MNLRNIILILVVNFLLNNSVFAAFKNYSSARALGMGEAFSTLATEVSGLYWNPAGIGDLKSREFAGMYSNDGLDTKYTFVSFGQPLNEWGGAGFSWSQLSNEFEKTSNQEEIIGKGDVSNNEFAFGMGYCRDLPISLGLTAKLSQEKIDNFSLNGWSINSGLLCEIDPIRFALVIENLFSTGLNGNSIVSGTVNEKLPLTIRIGISFFKNKKFELSNFSNKNNSPPQDTKKINDKVDLYINIGADIAFNFDEPDKSALNTGLEVWLNKLFAMRLGVREMRDFTTGLSLNIKILRLDYAFIYSRYLEKTHVFSTSLYF